MGRSTPLAFSLPSQQAGETDAMGLCTIRLLEEMQDTHNAIVERLHKRDRTGPVTTLKPAPGARPGPRAARTMASWGQVAYAPGVVPSTATGRQYAEGEPGLDEPEADDVEVLAAAAAAKPALPAISYLTAPAMVRRQLIVYDRAAHLLPLLKVFCVQPLGLGEVRVDRNPTAHHILAGHQRALAAGRSACVRLRLNRGRFAGGCALWSEPTNTSNPPLRLRWRGTAWGRGAAGEQSASTRAGSVAAADNLGADRRTVQVS